MLPIALKRMPGSAPQGGDAGKPGLLDQMRALLRAKYHALRAEEAYPGGWIRRFILFSGKRHPSTIGGHGGGAVSLQPGDRGPRQPST